MAEHELNTLSLYAILAAGGETIATHSIDTMQEISHCIEDGVLHAADKAAFYVSFQQFSRFAPQVARYREIAAHCAGVYVFGIPDWTPPPIANVIYVPLAPGSRLAREWFLVYDAPGYYTSLATEDTTGLQVPARQRIFRGAWTFLPEQVDRLRAALEAALGVPSMAPRYRDHAQEEHQTERMIGAVVNSLEKRNLELRRAYEQVQRTNEENARLQEIVRRYIAGSTWADAERSIRDGRREQNRIQPMTVMFTDIAGFTRFSEEHQPQEVVLALNGYFWWVSRIVSQHGGEINKYTGDGVLAVFPDGPRALAAGTEMLTRLAEWNAQRVARGQTPLQTRIGINAGRAIVGTIGGPDRQDRTVLGDVVNTAARLQAAARPGTILVSEHVFRGAGEAPDPAARRLLEVKGKAAPIVAYEYRQGGAEPERSLPSYPEVPTER